MFLAAKRYQVNQDIKGIKKCLASSIFTSRDQIEEFG